MVLLVVTQTIVKYPFSNRIREVNIYIYITKRLHFIQIKPLYKILSSSVSNVKRVLYLKTLFTIESANTLACCRNKTNKKKNLTDLLQKDKI